MVRRVVAACIAVVAVLTMSGCVSSAEASQAPAAVVVGRYSTPEEVVPLSATTAYLVTMHGLVIGLDDFNRTDAEMIQSGREVCSVDVANGLTWESLDKTVRAADLSVPFFRAYVQAAVAAFCPGAM